MIKSNEKKVALIAGGMGAEREVSLRTGRGFAKALETLGLPFEWVEAEADLPVRLQALKPDVALLALHGKYGEDGTVQGLCEYLKIPYSGSGVMASALCMNKYYTKQILMFHQLPTPRFEMYFTQQHNPQTFKSQIALPVVVKPSREGSTVGISIVKEISQMTAALELAAQYDREILIEEFIPGVELTVSIVDDKALTPLEIVPKVGFFDYDNKYTAGNTEYIIPPRLAPDVIRHCQDLALKAHKALQCRVFSRVDFRLSPEGKLFILEINTLPGCTPTSLLPKAAAYAGIEFPQLIRLFIERAGLDYEGVR
jgi:D-alanine-D-alanine ligase